MPFWFLYLSSIHTFCYLKFCCLKVSIFLVEMDQVNLCSKSLQQCMMYVKRAVFYSCYFCPGMVAMNMIKMLMMIRMVTRTLRTVMRTPRMVMRTLRMVKVRMLTSPSTRCSLPLLFSPPQWAWNWYKSSQFYWGPVCLENVMKLSVSVFCFHQYYWDHSSY